MTVDFLPFANDPATANVVTQAAYVAAATGNGYVQNGFVAGTASSAAANKALRQATVMAAALANFIANELSANVLDGGGASAVSAITVQIASAVQAAVQGGGGNYAADAGATNAMVATLSPAPTALTVGMTVWIKAAQTNTGATTLNLNGLGAQPVVGEEGDALLAGQIVLGSIHPYTWDGTSWRLAKPRSNTLRAAGTAGQIQFNSSGLIGAGAGLVTDGAGGLTCSALVSDISNKYQLITTTGGALTIDLSQGWNVGLTLNGNVTSVSFTNPPGSGTFCRCVMDVTNGGAFGISGWPASTIWTGGIVPTVTSGFGKKDTFVIASGSFSSGRRGYIVAQNMS